MSRSSYLLPPDIAEAVIRDSMAVASVVRTDQLDCNVSWARQPTDKTPEQVIRLGVKGKNTLWNFIWRTYPVEYVDVGLVTTVHVPSKRASIDYFLWLELSPENAQDIISKYKLQLA